MTRCMKVLMLNTVKSQNIIYVEKNYNSTTAKICHSYGVRPNTVSSEM